MYDTMRGTKCAPSAIDCLLNSPNLADCALSADPNLKKCTNNPGAGQFSTEYLGPILIVMKEGGVPHQDDCQFANQALSVAATQDEYLYRLMHHIRKRKDFRDYFNDILRTRLARVGGAGDYRCGLADKAVSVIQEPTGFFIWDDIISQDNTIKIGHYHFFGGYGWSHGQLVRHDNFNYHHKDENRVRHKKYNEPGYFTGPAPAARGNLTHDEFISVLFKILADIFNVLIQNTAGVAPAPVRNRGLSGQNLRDASQS